MGVLIKLTDMPSTKESSDLNKPWSDEDNGPSHNQTRVASEYGFVPGKPNPCESFLEKNPEVLNATMNMKKLQLWNDVYALLNGEKCDKEIYVAKTTNGEMPSIQTLTLYKRQTYEPSDERN